MTGSRRVSFRPPSATFKMSYPVKRPTGRAGNGGGGRNLPPGPGRANRPRCRRTPPGSDRARSRPRSALRKWVGRSTCPDWRSRRWEAAPEWTSTWRDDHLVLSPDQESPDASLAAPASIAKRAMRIRAAGRSGRRLETLVIRCLGIRCFYPFELQEPSFWMTHRPHLRWWSPEITKAMADARQAFVRSDLVPGYVTLGWLRRASKPQQPRIHEKTIDGSA